MSAALTVLVVAALDLSLHLRPLIGGGILLPGCLVILVAATLRETRQRRNNRQASNADARFLA